MKKMLLFTSILITLSASADMLKVEAGGGAWKQTDRGYIDYASSTESGSDTSTEKENLVGYAWIYLKHPIPILPNIRLEYTNLKYAGSVNVSLASPVSMSTTTTSTFDTRVYDGILYYNVLDNLAWMTLDVGLDAKMFDYDYKAAPNAQYEGYEKSGTLVVPMLYGRVRFEIPGTGLGLEGEGAYLNYDSATLYDARAKVDWTMTFVPVVQPGIEIGYRIMKSDYQKSSSEIKTDIDFSGVYAGAMVRF